MYFVDNRASIAVLLAELDDLTPGGFAMGMHLGYSGPAFLFQTFPQAWVDYYSEQGLQLRDPAVFWGFHNTGFMRWTDFADEDPADVMGKAASHGLTYGATISMVEKDSRSMGGFGRGDRDYLDAEIRAIQDTVLKLHRATHGLSTLSEDDMAALKTMSVRLSRF